jgi:hypothetical protein
VDNFYGLTPEHYVSKVTEGLLGRKFRLKTVRNAGILVQKVKGKQEAWKKTTEDLWLTFRESEGKPPLSTSQVDKGGLAPLALILSLS